MHAVFVELPPFERYREANLSDEAYLRFQNELLQYPERGDLMQGCGGLRKIRLALENNQKGKRGGGRVIYYYMVNRQKFLLVTAYNKNRQKNLTAEEGKMLSRLIQEIVEMEQ